MKKIESLLKIAGMKV